MINELLVFQTLSIANLAIAWGWLMTDDCWLMTEKWLLFAVPTFYKSNNFTHHRRYPGYTLYS